MAKPRKELRITLVVRSSAAPKAFDVLSQVEHGKVNARVVEMLNLATGDSPLPPSAEAAFEKMQKSLARIEAWLMGEAASPRQPASQPAAARAQKQADAPQEAKPERDGAVAANPQDSKTKADSLIDNLGID